MVPIDYIPLRFQSVIEQINDFWFTKTGIMWLAVNFVQITTRDITWQENLIRRFPVKYETAIKPCNVNKT